MEPQHPSQGRRETFLSFLLLVVMGGMFFFFLNLVSLGIFAHVAAAILAIAIVGLLHYVVWGHALSQEVAGERQEGEIRQQWEDENYPDPYSQRRF